MTEISDFRAIKQVTPAFNKAKRLLFEPFNLGVWVKLIIIMFFVGSTSLPTNLGNTMNWRQTGQSGNIDSQAIHDFIASPLFIYGVIAVILLVLVLMLLKWVLRGIFTFVLIDGASSGDVHIIRPFKANFNKGIKVFAAEFLVRLPVTILGVIIAAAILLWLYDMLVVNPDFGNGTSSMIVPSFSAMLAAIACLACILLPLTLLTNIVVGFIYDFVAPLMFFRDMSLREAAGHVWSLIQRNTMEFAVYVLIFWVLQIITGLMLAIPILILVAVFVVFAIICFFLGMAVASSTLLLALVVLLFLAGVVVFVVAVAAISMPVGVYFRYFSLDFLRSFDPSYVKYSDRMLPPEAPAPAPAPAPVP